MTTATPGPWRTEEEVIIERTGRVSSIYIAFYDAKEKRLDGRICQVFANCLVTTDEAVRANAKLIAAVPDLLTMAHQASFCLRTLLPNNPDLQFTIRLLERAISKAES